MMIFKSMESEIQKLRSVFFRPRTHLYKHFVKKIDVEERMQKKYLPIIKVHDLHYYQSSSTIFNIASATEFCEQWIRDEIFNDLIQTGNIDILFHKNIFYIALVFCEKVLQKMILFAPQKFLKVEIIERLLYRALLTEQIEMIMKYISILSLPRKNVMDAIKQVNTRGPLYASYKFVRKIKKYFGRQKLDNSTTLQSNNSASQ
jgi:hypothetical protein